MSTFAGTGLLSQADGLKVVVEKLEKTLSSDSAGPASEFIEKLGHGVNIMIEEAMIIIGLSSG